MDMSNEIRVRIIDAAERLFDETGRERFPTVDQVRRAARADMNTTSSVMKEWRRQQTAAPVSIAVEVPGRIQEVFQGALAEAWQEAQNMANESLHAAQQSWDAERTEAEDLRREMADAYESQALELESAKEVLELGKAYESDLEQQIQKLSQELADQKAHCWELEQSDQLKSQRIEELRVELAQDKTHAEQQARQHRTELEALRGKMEQQAANHVGELSVTQEQRDKAIQELAIMEARAEAQQDASAERQASASAEVRRLTNELVKLSEDADSRESWLKGQLEAAAAQHKELMAAIQKPKRVSTTKKTSTAQKVNTQKKAAGAKQPAAGGKPTEQ